VITSQEVVAHTEHGGDSDGYEYRLTVTPQIGTFPGVFVLWSYWDEATTVAETKVWQLEDSGANALVRLLNAAGYHG
jgi:hypothetical protein